MVDDEMLKRLEYDLYYRVDRYFNTIQMNAADVFELVGEIKRLRSIIEVDREGASDE